MISNAKMTEIKNRCNDFFVQLKHDNDTVDEFGRYTAQLNPEELKYCAAVFEILEAYRYGFIDQTECKKRHDKLILSLF